jgi:plasmid stability protein
MAQLIVRNLDPRLVAALRKRAAANGRSVEAEHRELLREVLRPSKRRVSLKDMLRHMPSVGDDDDFERPPQKPRRIRL